MEIKDRLQKIISTEGLTSAAFADQIGVQRSSISHILSGRNKPSLDFLQKILASFPKYSAEWLISGVGDVFKPFKQSTLFSDTNLEVLKPNEEDKSITNLLSDTTNLPKPEQNIPDEKKEIKLEDRAQKLHSLHLETPLNSNIEHSKMIERIVIFYADKTFVEYKP